jgi:NTP pyrophosphatase (non-canonical NTP hydrolase)
LNEEKVMGQRIGFPALVEQLAEEASELAQAALKVARITRKENPTPVSIEEGARQLEEEYTDVIQCAIELGIEVNVDQIRAKQRRFLRRWEEFEEEKRKRW